MVYLFQTCVAEGLAWVGVLTLLQLVCVERAHACRQARRQWLRNLDPRSGGPPSITFPAGLNRKTSPREIPLSNTFAALLHGWLDKKPLRSAKGQWPHEGQDTLRATACLFPGLSLKKKGARTWDKAVSERGYLKQLSRIGHVIDEQRRKAAGKGKSHVFTDYDITKLGTHSFKRSGVIWLKDSACSTAVIGKISGTSCRTLDEQYDMPTLKRQRIAVNSAFGNLIDNVSPSKKPKKCKWPTCSSCGETRTDARWKCCPFCCHRFANA